MSFCLICYADEIVQFPRFIWEASLPWQPCVTGAPPITKHLPTPLHCCPWEISNSYNPVPKALCHSLALTLMLTTKAAHPFVGSITRDGVYSSCVGTSPRKQKRSVYYANQWPFNGGKYRWRFYEECASGRDFILVKTKTQWEQMY